MKPKGIYRTKPITENILTINEYLSCYFYARNAIPLFYNYLYKKRKPSTIKIHVL